MKQVLAALSLMMAMCLAQTKVPVVLVMFERGLETTEMPRIATQIKNAVSRRPELNLKVNYKRDDIIMLPDELSLTFTPNAPPAGASAALIAENDQQNKDLLHRGLLYLASQAHVFSAETKDLFEFSHTST